MKKFGIKKTYSTIYFLCGIFEFRIYLKWDLWTKKYRFNNLGKIGGKKGMYLIMFWPFEILLGGVSNCWDDNAACSS